MKYIKDAALILHSIMSAIMLLIKLDYDIYYNMP